MFIYILYSNVFYAKFGYYFVNFSYVLTELTQLGSFNTLNIYFLICQKKYIDILIYEEKQNDFLFVLNALDGKKMLQCTKSELL